jgi:PadR family transcriptional regulator, regulatory protein PadR
MRPELLKGHLDALLLAVLEPGPQHGYAVIEALRAGSGGALDLPTGTVYPALHRLERAGLIRSEWETVGGRRRRAYRLTRAGRSALSEQRAVWDQFSTAVTALLRGQARISPA